MIRASDPCNKHAIAALGKFTGAMAVALVSLHSMLPRSEDVLEMVPFSFDALLA